MEPKVFGAKFRPSPVSYIFGQKFILVFVTFNLQLNTKDSCVSGHLWPVERGPQNDTKARMRESEKGWMERWIICRICVIESNRLPNEASHKRKIFQWATSLAQVAIVKDRLNCVIRQDDKRNFQATDFLSLWSWASTVNFHPVWSLLLTLLTGFFRSSLSSSSHLKYYTSTSTSLYFSSSFVFMLHS